MVAPSLLPQTSQPLTLGRIERCLRVRFLLTVSVRDVKQGQRGEPVRVEGVDALLENAYAQTSRNTAELLKTHITRIQVNGMPLALRQKTAALFPDETAHDPGHVLHTGKWLVTHRSSLGRGTPPVRRDKTER